MQFVALLHQHKICWVFCCCCWFFLIPFANKFKLSLSDSSALGFLVPAWSLPLQLSSHATAPHGNQPVRGLGSWQCSLAFNSSHKCFTFAKHSSKQQGFKLNTNLRLFMFRLRACQEHFLSHGLFVFQHLVSRENQNITQGLGHLVLVGITVQEQFHWPKHTNCSEFWGEFYICLINCTDQLQMPSVSSSPSERIYCIHWIKGEKKQSSPKFETFTNFWYPLSYKILVVFH